MRGTLVVLVAGIGTGTPPIPTPIGVGPLYRPPSLGQAAAARPVAGLRRERQQSARFGVHLELFAHGRVVIVPGFHAAPGHPVRAFVAGREWRGPIRTIPLHPHGQIVLEVGSFVPPHSRYLFPPGL